MAKNLKSRTANLHTRYCLSSSGWSSIWLFDLDQETVNCFYRTHCCDDVIKASAGHARTVGLAHIKAICNPSVGVHSRSGAGNAGSLDLEGPAMVRRSLVRHFCRATVCRIGDLNPQI